MGYESFSELTLYIRCDDRSSTHYWFGLHAVTGQWVDGNPSTYRNWASGEPDNYHRKCVIYTTVGFGDTPCYTNRNYLCKKGAGNLNSPLSFCRVY